MGVNVTTNLFPNLIPPANAGVIPNPSSFIWSNYVDLNHDVLPWLQIPAGQLTQDQLNSLSLVIDYVCQTSQQLKGNPIAATQFFGRFDGWSGWNGAYIEIPRYPILNVSEVAEWWGTSGPNYLSEQTPESQVWGYNLDAATGMLTRVFSGLVQMPWFPGARSIEVTWTAGYNPVPAMLKLPALEIIREWWTETQQRSRGGGAMGGPSHGMGMVNMESDTYPGLPLRVKAVFAATAQIGIG